MIHDLHKLNKIFGLLFMIGVISFMLSGSTISEEVQEYQKSGGEIVAIFDNNISSPDLVELTKQLGGKATLERHIEDYALFSVKSSTDYYEVLSRLKNNPDISEVQGNVDITSLSFSDDTYADTQWAIDNPGHYIYLSEAGRLDKPAVAGVDMDVLDAWTTIKESALVRREVVVAVIDTGVDYQHPDLADHMWINQGEVPGDNIDNDNNGYIDDVYGWDFYNNDSSVCHYKYSARLNKYVASPEDNDDHGTHVAGIIGATINNGIGVAGIASQVDVKIMSLKINGGPKGTGSLSGAVEAVKYATMMGADICNLSWGTGQYTSSLKQVMKESDMLFVAAAGNTGDDNNFNPIYPAGLNLDNLISVTFIDSAGELTSLSNYGTATVDLAAPGEDIFSTFVGNYGSMSGSSMAAPQVTAVAAMLYACSDHSYPAELKDLIMKNIKPLPGLDGYLKNNGIPSAYQALMSINGLPGDELAPVLSFDMTYSNENMVVSVSSQDQGASGVRVVRWSLGEKTVADFARGINGTPVEAGEITISKAGTYTFYASDYAGNEMIQTYQVQEDTTPPSILPTYTIAANYKSRTITVRVNDLESRVKRLEYMEGKHSAEEFLPSYAGVEVEMTDGKADIKVKKDGTYSIFAIDYRGNMAVKIVRINTVKATQLKLSKREKGMTVGDQYTLRAYLTPVASTDKVTFTSSDETVASISSTGRIKALANGTVVITVRTASGLKATCRVTIKTNASG